MSGDFVTNFPLENAIYFKIDAQKTMETGSVAPGNEGSKEKAASALGFVPIVGQLAQGQILKHLGHEGFTSIGNTVEAFAKTAVSSNPAGSTPTTIHY